MEKRFNTTTRGERNVAVIPAQHRVTQQILSRWQVEDSVLRTEMENLESEEEDASRRFFWYKPMSWLGKIRPHRRDEAWSAGLWQAFFACWCNGTGTGGASSLVLWLQKVCHRRSR